MSIPHLQLLSRRNCCLCEDAKQVLTTFTEQGLCSWETVNVDQDKALLVRFGMHVPVLLLDGKQLCRHRVTAEFLRSTLTELSL